MGRKHLTTEKFIQKAKVVHGNKYDYSLTIYKGSHIKVKIICLEHGEFEQLHSNHLNGNGCIKCCSKKLTIKEFIKKAKMVHGDKYDYSQAEYIITQTKIKIICPKHGFFIQKTNNHLNGQNCPKCKTKKRFNTISEFIKKAKMVHGDKYDYSQVDYKGHKYKVKITCPKHGEFNQVANYHLAGCGCPKCKSSHGERVIEKILLNKNIFYETQKKFVNCINIQTGKNLKFDFYLPDYNVCIEYDGGQHFNSIDIWGGKKSLKNVQKRDKIKNEFCQKNSIHLFRINYKQNIIKELTLFLEMELFQD